MKTILVLLFSVFAFCFKPVSEKRFVNAFTSGGSIGSANNKTSGTTLTITPTTTIKTGALIIICTASDNTIVFGGSDGSSEIVSIRDDANNVWQFADGFVNIQTGAGAGATAEIWYCYITSQLTTSNTITITWITSRTAKAATAWYFTKPHGNTITVASHAGLENDNADAGSITLGSLSNIEHIFVRCTAHEGVNGDSYTGTTNYTQFSADGTTGGGAATNMSVRAEFRILTATSSSTDPTYTTTDHASCMASFDEVAQTIPANAKGLFK